ncbi:MAG: ABC transporter ATP-binding protein [Rhodothermales bacterium]
MSVDLALHVESLSKRFRIGEAEERYDTLAATLAHLLTSPIRNFRRLRRLTSFASDVHQNSVVWGLSDVSFKVARGEVVGIIGRNGAGKSTLLKILARIMHPTHGRVEIYGRVASLLEVGTGFHPELTGRENVYLNGTVLGMTKAQVDERFEEIVRFSGVERFIDTPIKRYSSGMKVRLAFAVAAHLDPEILLIDEVLSVGDAEFQKKCLGKMQDVTRKGRTVLFVSHNLDSIIRLCDRTILLNDGRIVDDGPSEQVVATYLQSALGRTSYRTWSDSPDAPGGDYVRLCSVRIVDGANETVDSVDVRAPVGIEISFEVRRSGAAFVPWIALFTDKNEHIFSAFDTDPRWEAPPARGTYTSTAWIPGNLLNEGIMLVNITLNTFASGVRNIRQVHVDEAVTFQVYDAGGGDTSRGNYQAAFPGPVRPLLDWTFKRKVAGRVVSNVLDTK